jgi:NAD(P)-dependent dehydrogenase (short-subunit alcohol dehydrogenase family)
MVFIGSVSGHTYAAKETVYGAAKAALHRMVESAGRELAPLGVGVNAVAPGFTRTPRERAARREAVDRRLRRHSARHGRFTR